MHDNKYSQYLKSISQYFGASLIPMVLNLAINPFLSLAMEPEDFAIVGYYSSFSTLISPIIIFYLLHFYNKRYFELDTNSRKRLRALLFKSLIFFSFSVSIVCFLTLYFYINFYTNNSFSTFPYLYLSVFCIPFTGIYNLELADLKMKRDSSKYMRIAVVVGVFNIATIVLFVIICRLGAFGKLFAPLFVNICVFVYLLWKHKDVWKIHNNFKELYSILKFCSPLVIGASLGYFSNGYDKAILEGLGDITEFGYYCIGSSIAAYLNIFTNALGSTFQPDVYEAIIKDNRKKLIRVIALRWFLTLGVVCVFIIFCPLLIKILTAGKYLEATKYARLFALVPLTTCVYYIINDYSIAKNKTYYYTITTVIGSIITFFLMPHAVSSWGFYGGVFMTIISFILLSLINALLFIIGSLFTVLKRVTTLY